MTTESEPGEWERILHPPAEVDEQGEADEPRPPRHSWQAVDGLKPLPRPQT